ncbi:hypothetical protein HDU88_007974 [Geranomyces variabilis]|nr:hypothetical protein HDU88_007974 [Geranomyces variabilis]
MSAQHTGKTAYGSGAEASATPKTSNGETPVTSDSNIGKTPVDADMGEAMIASQKEVGETPDTCEAETPDDEAFHADEKQKIEEEHPALKLRDSR